MDLTGRIKTISIDYETNKPKIELLLNERECADLLVNLKDDNLYIKIDKMRNKRSLDANALFHLLVNRLARHFNISDEDMKIKMNLDYGTIARFDDGRVQGCKVPNGTNIKNFYKYAKWYKTDEEGNDCYIFYKETHTLNTKEMSQLIKGVIQECQDVGIETEPQEKIDSLLREWGN